MKTVDLNADVGESVDAQGMQQDAQLIPLLTSVNIACGFHAGNPATIEATVETAVRHHVSIGAHPGFADPEGFGRRPVQITPEEAYQLVLYQSGAVRAFATARGVRLHHVKLHGALYNMSAADPELSKGIVRAVKALGDDLTITVLSGSVTEEIARDAGLKVAREVFADRRYLANGQLVPRSDPRAMITSEQESIDQVVKMVTQGTCTAVCGKEIKVEADTICLHGDQPSAVAFAGALRAALTRAGITPCAYL